MNCTYEAQRIEKHLSLIMGRPVRLHNPEVLLLNPTLFKKAYYNQAQKYHPDKAASRGLDPAYMAANFRSINEAYTHVLESWNSGDFKTLLLNRRHQSKPTYYTQEKARTQTQPRTQTKSNPTQAQKKANTTKTGSKDCIKPLYHAASIPNMELRFAQYLYYSRKIDWKTLIDALSWQFKTRPKFGSLGIEFGFLNYDSILDILSKRMQAELFGDTAIRLGYLNTKERFILIGRQRLFNLPIGSYFTEKGILNEEEIPSILDAIRKHNYAVKASKKYLYD